jgi:hypothetical protein
VAGYSQPNYTGSAEPHASAVSRASTGAPFWTAAIVGGALLFLIVVRSGFRSIVVRMPN